MRWHSTLVIRQPYFVVGFVDEQLTVPSIGSFIYMGQAAMDDDSPMRHVFQDAHSFLSTDPDNTPPNYITLDDEALDMVADKAGLVRWLQADHTAEG
jgi:hypothetical protein